MTRRVEEDDALAVVGDLAGADVLGDAAALAGRDLGRADGVEQARLAVVDVTHDGHDRGARLQEGGIVLLEQDLLGRLGDPLVLVGADGPRGLGLGHFVAELAGHERRGVAVDQLVDGREDAALDQLADDVRGVDPEQLGELLDGDRAGQLDRAPLTRDRASGRRIHRMRRRDAAACGARDGRACRSYSWPRAPPSMIVVHGHWVVGDAPRQRIAQVGRERGLERPAEGTLGDGFVEAGLGPADVGAAPGGATGLVGSHVPGRRPDDPQELALRADRAACDAGAVRDATRRDGPGGPAYDATSSVGTAAAFLDARLGFAAGASSVAAGSVAAGSVAATSAVAAGASVSGSAVGLGGGSLCGRLLRHSLRLGLGLGRDLGGPGVGHGSLGGRGGGGLRLGDGRLGDGGIRIGGRGLGLGDRHVTPDVDPPAGQAGGEPGVLALAADRQREHPLGHRHARDPVLLVDVDGDDLGRAERVRDEQARIVAPRDDVDLLAGQLGDDGLDAGAALADGRADGVEPLLA